MIGLMEMEFFDIGSKGSVEYSGIALVNPEDVILAQECLNPERLGLEKEKISGEKYAYMKNLNEGNYWIIKLRSSEQYIVKKNVVDKFKIIE